MVEVFFEDTEELSLDLSKISSWLTDLCADFKKELADLSIIFCSDEYLLELNRTHLNHDYFTDIITFDYCTGNLVSGDLFISVDRVRENANSLEEMFHVELFRVMAHGTLHLLGFKDKTENDAREMRIQEDRALGMIVSRET